jgi:hypothetical protein
MGSLDKLIVQAQEIIEICNLDFSNYQGYKSMSKNWAVGKEMNLNGNLILKEYEDSNKIVFYGKMLPLSEFDLGWHDCYEVTEVIEGVMADKVFLPEEQWYPGKKYRVPKMKKHKPYNPSSTETAIVKTTFYKKDPVIVYEDDERFDFSRIGSILAFILLCILLFSFSSCSRKVVTKTITETIIKKDTMYITKRDTIVVIKEVRLEADIKILDGIRSDILDSIQLASVKFPKKKVVIYDNDSTTRLEVNIDSLGNLTAECKSLERTLRFELLEKTRIIEKLEKKIIEYETKKTKFGSLMSDIKKFVSGWFAAIFVILALVLTIYLYTKRFSKWP